MNIGKRIVILCAVLGCVLSCFIVGWRIGKTDTISDTILPQEVQTAAQQASEEELERRTLIDSKHYQKAQPSSVKLVYQGIFEGVALEVYQVVTKLSYISGEGTTEWETSSCADTMIFRVDHENRELLGIDNTSYAPDSDEFKQLLHAYLMNSGLSNFFPGEYGRKVR